MGWDGTNGTGRDRRGQDQMGRDGRGREGTGGDGTGMDGAGRAGTRRDGPGRDKTVRAGSVPCPLRRVRPRGRPAPPARLPPAQRRGGACALLRSAQRRAPQSLGEAAAGKSCIKARPAHTHSSAGPLLNKHCPPRGAKLSPAQLAAKGKRPSAGPAPEASLAARPCAGGRGGAAGAAGRPLTWHGLRAPAAGCAPLRASGPAAAPLAPGCAAAACAQVARLCAGSRRRARASGAFSPAEHKSGEPGAAGAAPPRCPR